VTESVIESEVGHDYTRVFSGRFEKITQGFQKNKNILPEFNSEDEFVSYVKNGTELMFTNEGAAARGVKFVLRLI
jgi:hypothetical protein